MFESGVNDRPELNDANHNKCFFRSTLFPHLQKLDANYSVILCEFHKKKS